MLLETKSSALKSHKSLCQIAEILRIHNRNVGNVYRLPDQLIKGALTVMAIQHLLSFYDKGYLIILYNVLLSYLYM